VTSVSVFAGVGDDQVTNTLLNDTAVAAGDGNDRFEGGERTDDNAFLFFPAELRVERVGPEFQATDLRTGDEDSTGSDIINGVGLANTANPDANNIGGIFLEFAVEDLV